MPLTSVAIPGAFSANDGPPPYTVVSAAFMNLQLPLMGLGFTPLGGNSYVLSAGIAPMAQVSYLDGNNIPRAKFVQGPMPLTGAVTSNLDPAALRWWAFLESGSISNLQLSGATLSFTATAAIRIIATSSEPGNFPVLEGFTCFQQPPVEAQCQSIYPLESICRLSDPIPGSSTMAIPFTPLGPTPYSNPIATSLGGPPYVLRVVPQSADVTMIDLAFPVSLSYTDGNGQTQTQLTNLFMSLLMGGVVTGPNTRIIADLQVSSIIPSGDMTLPALTLQQVFLSGTIASIGEGIQVLVTSAVQCGAPPLATCQPILPPPTAEITA